MRIWVKLYTEILRDPKLHKLSDGSFRAFVNLLALAGTVDKNGQLGTAEEVAFHLRTEPETACAVLQELATVHVTSCKNGVWRLKNWSSYNGRPPSDRREAVSDRVRKHREKQAKVAPAVTDGNAVTPALQPAGNESRVDKNREEQNREEQTIKDSGAPSAPGADAPPAQPEATSDDAARTPASRVYFQIWSRHRWANNEQRDFFEQTERDVGSDILTEAVRWGARENIPKISSICTHARKVAEDRKKGRTPNGVTNERSRNASKTNAIDFAQLERDRQLKAERDAHLRAGHDGSPKPSPAGA